MVQAIKQKAKKISQPMIVWMQGIFIGVKGRLCLPHRARHWHFRKGPLQGLRKGPEQGTRQGTSGRLEPAFWPSTY